jgi:hypothetical protein
VAGLLAAMFFTGALGAIYGAVFGALAGTAIGALCGVLVLPLVRATAHPSSVGGRYFRRAVGLVCAAAAVLVLLAAWAATGFRQDAPVGAGPTGTIDGGAADVAFWAAGPALVVAAWAAGLAGRRVSGWWIRKDRTDEDPAP